MDRSPFVSILMPIRNEAAFIERSLGAVLEQDYPADCMEVIVADGMSTDQTREIVSSMRPLYKNLRLIQNPKLTAPAALNSAFAEARGEVVIWIGGHTEIAPDYVSQCVKYLQSGEFDCVGGHIETVAETSLGQTIALAMSTSFGVGGVDFRTKPNQMIETDTVAFGAYRRSAMEKAGPLDEKIRNEDDEYNYRLRKLGGRILLAPDIRSRYYSRSSVPMLWKQYLQYGFWKVRVMQKHPAQMRMRHFAPSAFVGGLLLSALLAPMFRPGRRLLGLVSGAYLVASLVASVSVARKQGWRHLPLLPMIFATMHFSYGLGFLAGLVRFWNRWSG